MRFKDKSIVITGGAGGIGRALARTFAIDGGKVMVSDLSETGCQEICEELSQQDCTVDYFTGNLADKSYCEDLIARTVEPYGFIDVLINNAGIIPPGALFFRPPMKCGIRPWMSI
jgi:NAD(P)-dependent dehydrogenase (short-subunit alcohol dehydrogenase family)